MKPTVPLLFGSLGLVALLGCSSSDSSSPTASYLVNGIAVADLDANGRPDILGMVYTQVDTTPTPGYVSTRLQTAPGAFAGPARYGVGTSPANFVAKDVNGDGRPDLVVANAQDRTISVHLADPGRPGIFFPPQVLGTPGRTPLDVAVGDLNGDGRVDIVVAASGANSVLVFTQTAAGTFDPPVAYAVGGDPQSVTVADLDGNGFADIAVGTTANAVSVLLQTSAGTFATAVDYATGPTPVAVRAADLDGDGKLDLLTANFGFSAAPGAQGLSVLFQAAAGTFAAPVHYATADRPVALAVGDLNGDGRPDVAVACEGLPGDSGAVTVFMQDAATAGLLLPPASYRGVWGPMGVEIADMNGDGYPDLVLADGNIAVRFNSPASPGTFGQPTLFYN